MSPTSVDDYRLLIADVYELAGVSRRTSEDLARRRGRTVSEWNVLSVLSQDELSVSAAARRLGLARQSVQPVVDRLVADGLLHRRDNPADARAPLATTNSAGDDELAALWAASDPAREAELQRAGISAAELRAARATIRTLTAVLRES